MKLTHAMILAAGLGTRMRPLTNDRPKPLIEVAGKALIDHCLDWLEAGGVTQGVINSSYRAAQLEAHVATRTSPKVTISPEGEPPLETGGGVAKALPLLGAAPFLVMNSDALFCASVTHPLAAMQAAWHEDIDFLMLVVPRERAIGRQGNGDFVLSDEGRVRRPRAGEDAPYVFTGVEIIHPRAFDGCPEGAFSLAKLWQRNAEPAGWFARVRAVVFAGDWLNVGDLPGLQAAEDYLGGGVIGSRM
jgi:MurNAc alpha-1-phosphate uridylyltransferase